MPPEPADAGLSWAAAVAELDVAVLAADRAGTVVLANPAANALFGDPDPVFGRPLVDVVVGDDVHRHTLAAGDLDTLQRDRMPLQRFVRRGVGHTVHRFDVRVAAVDTVKGVAGFVVRVVDLGESVDDLGPFTTMAQRGELTVGRVTVDLASRVVRVQGRPARVRLTGREFELLRELMRYPGRTHTREQLLRTVWGTDFPASTSVVDVTMSRLRHKLPLTELSTHRTDGYAFERRADHPAGGAGG